jgi:CysZ protein
VLRVISLSLVDLTEARILAILFRSLFVSLLIFLVLGLVAVWMLSGSDPCAWAGQSCELGLSASGLGALLITVVGIWLLFPAVALGVIAAYSDRIVATVEAIHYSEAAVNARPVGMARGALLGLRSAARLLLYNLVALPFYILLLVTGVGTIILFILVNGVAIGRDFGEMVAVRHGDAKLHGSWLRATRSERAAIGIIVTAIFLVPLVNLVAPLLGATMATHLFHRGRISS